MKRMRIVCALLLVLMLALPCPVIAEATTPDIDTMEGLKSYFSGKSIAILTGSVFDGIAKDLFPDAERVFYSSYADMTIGLAAGKVDGLITDAPTVAQLDREKPHTFYTSRATLRDDHYGYALQLGNTTLRDQIDAVVQKLSDNGELDAIRENWFSGDPERMKMPDITLTGENGTLRVATDPTMQPFTYSSHGTVVGYDVDLLTRVAKEYGYALEIQTMDFGGLIPSIVSGRADVACASISITPERAEQVLFTQPNYYGSVVAVLPYALKPAPAPLDAYDQKGVRIGVPTGAMAMAAAEKRFTNAEIVHYNADADAFMALMQGHIDAYAHDHVTLRYAAGSVGDVKVLSDSYGGTDIAVGISKSRNDLIAPINAVIKKFKELGLFDDMMTRWTTDAEHAMPDIAAPSSPKGTIKLGTAGLVAPMTYFGAGGELTGFDLEFAKRLALELNVNIEATSANFDALVAGLQSGKFDIVISNLNITPERAEMIDFSDPYMELYLTLMVRDEGEAATPYATLSELQAYFGKGSKIGVNTGSVFDKISEEFFPEAEKVYYTGYPDAISGLKSGKINGYLTDKPQAIAQCLSDDALWMPSAVIKDDLYALAIKPGNDALLKEIDEFLLRLRSSGELDAMAEKWFLTDEAKKPMPDVTPTGEKGQLTLCTTGNSYPFSYVRDGVAVGYELEIFYRFCAEYGYSPVIETAEFAGIIAAVSSGRADVAAGCISVTDERREKMLFSEPTYFGGMVAVLPASVLGSAEKTEAEISFFESLAASFERTFLREGRWKMVLSGLLVTLLISVCAGLLGTALGFIVCMANRSRFKVFSALAQTFVRIVQGTPIVVMLMILYYLVFDNVDAVLVAIIGFAVNFAAYVSEMMRTGIDAVDKGQIEAASAIGFTRVQTFIGITMPQAARHFLPVFRGEFISLVKMTSVVGYITIQDLTKVSDIIRSRTYEAFFPLIATAVIYFLLSWLLTLALSAIEVRIDPKHKKRDVKGVIAQAADASAIRN